MHQKGEACGIEEIIIGGCSTLTTHVKEPWDRVSFAAVWSKMSISPVFRSMLFDSNDYFKISKCSLRFSKQERSSAVTVSHWERTAESWINEGHHRVSTSYPDFLSSGSLPPREVSEALNTRKDDELLAGYLWLGAKQNKQNKGLVATFENFALITENLENFCRIDSPVCSPTKVC